MAAIPALLLAALAAPAFAYCPNGCSGHGSCGINDKCECKRPNGDGRGRRPIADAARPEAAAWVAVSVGAERGAPACAVLEQGRVRRQVGRVRLLRQLRRHRVRAHRVPERLQRRGICYTQKQLAAEARKVYSTPWDAMKHVGCVCDLGFRGPTARSRSARRARTCSAATATRKGRDCLGPGISPRRPQCFVGTARAASTRPSSARPARRRCPPPQTPRLPSAPRTRTSSPGPPRAPLFLPLSPRPSRRLPASPSPARHVTGTLGRAVASTHPSTARRQARADARARGRSRWTPTHAPPRTRLR